MTTPIALNDITIHPVVEQQGAWFEALGFFPTVSKDLLDENRAWLEPTFLDPTNNCLVFCIQAFVIRTPHHNILVDACVGNNKPRPTRPFWNMLDSDRFENGLRAIGLGVNDIDYVMCTHLHGDHVGWNTQLENGRWVPTFPKARYIMADRELKYWTERERDNPQSGITIPGRPARPGALFSTLLRRADHPVRQPFSGAIDLPGAALGWRL